MSMPRRWRRGPGAADRRDIALRPETVEILPSRQQKIQFDVYGVRGFRPGGRDTAPDDLAEALVRRNLPLDRNDPGRHPAETVLGERA
jgi:hypothetical protein